MTARAGPRRLIVNADDFGRSPGINRGVVVAHERGIVTSASLMVRWPAAAEAATYARLHPRLSVGLHFDLGEWACRPDGEWVRLYSVAREDDGDAVARQLALQLDAFRVLLGREPTHLDSHQHVHATEPVRSALIGAAHRLGVPLRGHGRAVRYVGDFYGQNEAGWPLPELIGVEALVELLGGIGAGWTELGCHPGLGVDLDSMYLREREVEVGTLCDRRVRAAVTRLGIELQSHHDVRGLMRKLLPDELAELWETVDEREFTGEQFYHEQLRRLGGYRATWERALTLAGQPSLKRSLVWELGEYLGIADLDELWRRCSASSSRMRSEWEATIDPGDRSAVERYYDDCQAMMDELIWWHTLEDDLSPLAYVTALEFARQRGCRTYLDFGSGIGSGAILFARHGFEVSAADISPSLLRFDRWRFDLRGLRGRLVDTSSAPLPHDAFDLVTAMDVFEHLADPVEAAETLWRSLAPGGFLFGRFGVDDDENKPMHIVKDFGPMFERLRELGMREVWRDDWLWGHQVYQKT